MRRREFIGGLGGMAAWPVVARARICLEVWRDALARTAGAVFFRFHNLPPTVLGMLAAVA